MRKIKRIVLAMLMLLVTFALGCCGVTKTPVSAPQIALEGDVVSWQAVANAGSYDVYVNGEKEESTVMTSYTLVLEAGSYQIKVKAVPSDTQKYEVSAFSNAITYISVSDSAQALNAPEIALEGNVVSWQAVDNALNYDVYADGVFLASVAQTSYALSITENGNYQITVVAKGDGVYYTPSVDSNAVAYKVGASSPVKLNAPDQPTVNENVVSWGKVENAVSYDVYVNGTFEANVTQTNYALEFTAEGTYKITVVAKGDGEAYADSDASAEASCVCVKYFVKIEKCSDPTTTVYYLDENTTALDLSGMSVEAVYSNGDRETVTLAESDIISEYDLSVAGRYELEFAYTGANNVKSSVVVVVNVRVRTVSDVDEYEMLVNEYGEMKYQIADFEATGAVAMDGTALSVSLENGKTYVASSDLAEGETFLRITDGTSDTFANVLVARYIKTVDDFNAIEENMDGYYLLMNDLDFTGVTCDPIGRAPVLYDEGCKIDFTGVGGGTNGVVGVAFNGTFNGNGYVLKNFSYTGGNGESWWKGDSYAIGLFGYVSKTGCVKNLTLRNVTIRGGNNSAFIAGLNEGHIENICIEESCYLFNAFGDGAVISACNYGTTKNVVSYVSKTDWNYGSEGAAVKIVKKETDYTSDMGVNGYIGDTSDLTEILGEGWMYIKGYGTVYGDVKYKVLSADKVWYVGDEIKIAFWQKTEADVYFAVWGTSAADPTAVLAFVSYDAATCTYTLKFADGITVAANTKLAVGIGITGVGYVEQFDVTVGEPYATGYKAPTATIEAEQGSELDPTTITITVTYSDGSEKKINPVSIEGYDKLGAIGQTQTVKLFYGEGEDDYVLASVTLIEGASSGYELKVSAANNVLVYSATASVDLSGVTFTLVTSDGEKTLSSSDLEVSGLKSGLTTLTFTYSDGDITVRATYEFEIWYTITQASEWAMMNDNLSGYYVLGNDIDLQGATYSAIIGVAPLKALTEGYWIDSTGVGSAQAGVAFTGKFDGNGKTVTGFTSAYGGAAYAMDAYALTPFAYVGEGGYVGDFTLAGSSIKCGQNGSFLVGLNLGTVENITIALDCTLYVHYSSASPYAVVVNGGTVHNITCNVTTFTKSGDETKNISGAVHENVGNGTETDCSFGVQA